MTILLALAAAGLFGAGVALQQRPATEVPDELAVRPGLLVRVARQPVWVLGVIFEICGFGFQVAALRRGSLVVVQPLMTTSLLFTIALSGRWTKAVTRRDGIGVVAVVVGLATFLAVASPSEQSAGTAGFDAWVVTGSSLAAALAVLVVCGLSGGVRRRAIALGLAAGLADGLMAVLTKAFAQGTERGLGSVVISWVPYALCLAGLGAMLITQSAYQVGHPTLALPLITVTEPIVSCAVGVGLFGEAIHVGGARAPFVIAAIVVMAAGLVDLSRARAARDAEMASRA